jgi:hypothetical protein
MYLESIYENRRMKPVEIVLRRQKGKRMEGVNLRYIVSTYVNIIMYLSAQLLNANKMLIN